jgi:hypothetical protein
MKEKYTDEGLLSGTHSGADGSASLQDLTVHFEITHAIGRLLKNVTQDTSAVVTAHTLNTCTAPAVSWDNGDEYILYVGATADAVISSTVVCRKSGFAYPRWELGPGGIHPDHEDTRPEEVHKRRVKPTKLRR